MSSVVISGDTSGAITLSAPAVAGTNTITLPAATGTAVVTGTTPTLNGITFPATAVPSADANTLDDYEEGSWTPSVGGNATYTQQIGIYTKVGNLCTVHFRLQLGTRGTGSNTTLSGLPFTSASSISVDVYSGTVSYFSGVANSVNYLSMYVNQGGTTMRFPLMTSTTTGTSDNASVFQDATTLYGSATYMTA